VREAIRQANTILPSFDYVVVAGPKIAERPFADLAIELVDLIERMNKRWAAQSESS
jgi:RNase P protein component